MTAHRVAIAALLARWSWIAGAVVGAAAVAWFGPAVAPVAAIAALSVTLFVVWSDLGEARDQLDDAIDREARAIARAAIADARATAAEAVACPLCQANRRRAEQARKVAS